MSGKKRKIGKVRRGKKTIVWVDSAGNVWEMPARRRRGRR